MNLKNDDQVYLYKIPDDQTGCIPIPCDPDKFYPEYPFNSISARNYIYESIREIFLLNGYDADNYGTSKWNPLGCFIKPGQTVLLKPNLVLHRSHKKEEDYYSVVTHPAIIRCMVDYVYLALKGNGRIIIGDAPLNNADFDLLCSNLGLNEIKNMYAAKGVSIDVEDFRLYRMHKDEKGVISDHYMKQDQKEYLVARLGNDSLLNEFGKEFKQFRVTEYDGKEMPLHHNEVDHEYFIHKSVFQADVIINLPKIKTHRKAGYTCAMKNFVGINGSKDWLPHHRKHSLEEGGDEYKYRSIRKKLISGSWDLRWRLKNAFTQNLLINFERLVCFTSNIIPFKDQYFEGSWWGNSTISRTINDLNRVIIYGDKNAVLQDTPQRLVLNLVDGIICGEGEGPMMATSKRCNILLWGVNSFAVDMVVVRLMGFNSEKIDTLKVCQNITNHKIVDYNPHDIEIYSNIDKHKYSVATIRNLIGFEFTPSQGWINHIELNEN